MDAGTIITIAIPVVSALTGFIFHKNKKSHISEACVNNYSNCIMSENPNCDKILEVCGGYVKIEKKTTTNDLQEM